MLNSAEKKKLLKIAREAIEAKASGKLRLLNPAIESEALKQNSGAFVSLHKNGRLRGCIGVFASKAPLWKTVQENAVAAAFRDPRFDPVEKTELPRIDIEISVLTPLKEIIDTNEIEVGRHGIFIKQGRCAGVLLPQVAIEHDFDRDTFLAETCLKADLPEDAWQNGASIYIFEAEIFGEKEMS
jgi:AmmeMemoRadiSam system protein A